MCDSDNPYKKKGKPILEIEILCFEKREKEKKLNFYRKNKITMFH